MSQTTLTALLRDMRGRQGIDFGQADMLRTVALGEADHDWVRRLSNPQRVRLAELTNLGWIERDGKEFRLSADARTSFAPALRALQRAATARRADAVPRPVSRRTATSVRP